MTKNFYVIFGPPKTWFRRSEPKSNISLESSQAPLGHPFVRSSGCPSYLFTISYLSGLPLELIKNISTGSSKAVWWFRLIYQHGSQYWLQSLFPNWLDFKSTAIVWCINQKLTSNQELIWNPALYKANRDSFDKWILHLANWAAPSLLYLQEFLLE